MVLAELGTRLQNAIHNQLSSAPTIDEKTFDSLLKDICKALLDSDVNVKLVQSLRENVRSSVNLLQLPDGINRRRLIQRTVFDALCKLVDPGVEPFRLQRGQTNVVMFVGLQGAGKTTSCTKYAFHYLKKGWKVGIVCADTFRAGAFDQLKQNASKAKIPYYGSYTEADPVTVAREGVAKFRQERFELIIIDTSGRHKQEAELFQEMRQISLATSPNGVIMVMDASIGQIAESQAAAFNSSVPLGAIILSKMDGHAKGGGALSGVAVTRSPIIFIGTGEHIYDLEPFSPHSFVNKLLGFGDIKGIVEKVQELKIDENSEFAKRIEKGIFTLREMQQQFSMIMQMGPISKVMGMLPGFSNLDIFQTTAASTNQNGHSLTADQEISRRMRRFMAIMDSMTEGELDSDAKIILSQPTRIQRISLGSGTGQEEVLELLGQYKKFAQLVKGMGGKNGLFESMSAAAAASSSSNSSSSAVAQERTMSKMTQQLSRFVPPEMMRQFGGAGGLSEMMRQFQSGLGGVFGQSAESSGEQSSSGAVAGGAKKANSLKGKKK